LFHAEKTSSDEVEFSPSRALSKLNKISLLSAEPTIFLNAKSTLELIRHIYRISSWFDHGNPLRHSKCRFVKPMVGC